MAWLSALGSHDFLGTGGSLGRIHDLAKAQARDPRCDMRRLASVDELSSPAFRSLMSRVNAFAQANVTRYSFPMSFSFEDVDPCTGNPTVVEISGTAYVHEVYDDDSGLITSTFKLRGTVTGTDLNTGERVSGPLVWNWSEAGGFDGPATYVYTAHITSPGPGNNILLVDVIHISPNGVIHDDNTAHLIDACLDQPKGN